MFAIIWSHIHGRARAAFVLAPLIMFGEVSCDLQQPTLMSQIIDHGLAQGDGHYVLTHTLLMLGLALLGLLFGAGAGSLGSYASLTMGAALRQHLLTIALTDRRPDGLSTATLITRITNDVTQMQNLVMLVTRGLVRSPLLLLGGIVMSVLVSPALAPILLVVLPILVVVMALMVRRSLPLYLKLQQAVDRMNRLMRENLQGAKTIKAYVLEPHQRVQFAGGNAELQAAGIAAAMATVPLAPVIQGGLNLAVVVALWQGGTLAATGHISTGQIIAFVNYLIQITTAMVQTVNLITAFARAITSAGRVQAVLDQAVPAPRLPAAPALPANPSLDFSHVTFGYQQSTPILADFSLHVPAGSWLGIIGATGAGKTTLIDLLTRRFDDYTGTIAIAGQDIQTLPLATVHTAVARAYQDASLFSGTVAANLRYGAPNATPAAMTAAATIAAADFIPDFDAPVAPGGRNWSGGQRQRLNIARALVPDAPVVVFDDATSAVDQRTNATILQRLTAARKNRTTLMISQRVTNVMHCDQIIVLANGRLAALGTHAELLRQNAFYRRLVTTQLGAAYANDET